MATTEAGGNRKRFAEKLSYWEQLRQAIVHEDNLVHHRLTWLLTIEGFVAAGFFAVQALVISNDLPLPATCVVEGILVTVLFLSLWFCLTVELMMKAAYSQIASIEAAWNKRYRQEALCGTRQRLRLFGGLPPVSPEQCPLRTTSPPANDGVPEFPPIIASFDYPTLLNTRHLPYGILMFNIILIVGCVALGIMKRDVGTERFTVQVDKRAPGIVIKGAYKGSPSDDLPEELKDLLRPSR